MDVVNFMCLIFIVVLAGGVGGVVNALMTDNTFMLPGVKEDDGVWRAGVIGNIIVSAIAGLITWGSVAPVSGVVLCTLSVCEPRSLDPNANFLTMGTLMTTILVGIAGARWLTSEIDKKIMKKQEVEIKALKVK